MSRLVRELQPIARRIARSALNTPDMALHMDARILGWILAWPHQTQLSVRSYIARCAANEARRIVAMRETVRTEYFRRWQYFAPVVRIAGAPEGSEPSIVQGLDNEPE